MSVPKGRQQPARLPPDYLVGFADQIVGGAWRRYQSFFDESEAHLIHAMRSMSSRAKHLHARLWSRQRTLVRWESLTYTDTPEREEAAKELVSAGLLLRDWAAIETVEVEDALAPLKLAELRSLADELGVELHGRRADILEELSYVEGIEVAITDRMACVTLPHRDLLERMEILYFGSAQHGLSTLVATALAHMQWETVTVDEDSLLFPDRTTFEEWLEARSWWLEGVDEYESDALFTEAIVRLEGIGAVRDIPSWQLRVRPERYWARWIGDVARELERRDLPQKALPLYHGLAQTDHVPKAQAEALERLGLLAQRGSVTAVALSMFEAESTRILECGHLDEIALFRLRMRQRRLKLGDDPRDDLRQARPCTLALASSLIGRRRVWFDRDGFETSIEIAVLDALPGEGMLAENDLMRTIVALLTWEVWFHPIPGAYQHRFQHSPLDLGASDFWSRREALFEQRFRDMNEERIGPALARADRLHRGKAHRWIRWENYQLSELQWAADAIGARGLSGIARRLMQAPLANGAGFPDLLLVERGEGRFVEVKGPGDQLRPEQRLWHHTLLGLGLAVDLVRVEPRTLV